MMEIKAKVITTMTFFRVMQRYRLVGRLSRVDLNLPVTVWCCWVSLVAFRETVSFLIGVTRTFRLGQILGIFIKKVKERRVYLQMPTRKGVG